MLFAMTNIWPKADAAQRRWQCDNSTVEAMMTNSSPTQAAEGRMDIQSSSVRESFQTTPRRSLTLNRAKPGRSLVGPYDPGQSSEYVRII